MTDLLMGSESKQKPTVLISAHYFLPANKAGGPPKSIANLIDTLKESFRFKVICSNHEFRAPDEPLPVTSDVWIRYDDRDVLFQSPSLRAILILIKESLRREVSTIYFNSFFDPRYTILPLLIMSFFTRKSLFMSPRGEFSGSALEIKGGQKKLYLRLFKFLALQRRVKWLATSEKEKQDILGEFGHLDNIYVAANLPSPKFPDLTTGCLKRPQRLRLVYLARIAPMKNTQFLFRVLQSVKANVVVDIWGPIEDKSYWQACLSLAGELPGNIELSYKGEVPSADVLDVLSHYDAYFLPTLGENFGHSIFEAMSVGLPVIISDQTPWRRLSSQGVGFDLPLKNPEPFAEAIEAYAKMDIDAFAETRHRVRAFAENYIQTNKNVELARAAFSQERNPT